MVHGGKKQEKAAEKTPSEISPEFFNVDEWLTGENELASDAAAANTSSSPVDSEAKIVVPSDVRHSTADPHFSDNFGVPDDIVADLEWVSAVLESPCSGVKQEPRVISQASRDPQSAPSSSSLLSSLLGYKRSSIEASSSEGGGHRKKCLHCKTTRTPQWRYGPMGRNTLCNACGLMYRKGQLVPEYRPVMSPTFSPSEHSNSCKGLRNLRNLKDQHPSSPKDE
ncbi:GATA transcription factor 4-like [Wolffia australiana]